MLICLQGSSVLYCTSEYRLKLVVKRVRDGVCLLVGNAIHEPDGEEGGQGKEPESVGEAGA